MDSIKLALAAANFEVLGSAEIQIQDLNDLQLALVGGGCGEVVLA